MIYLFKLDEKSRKVILVLCALFILLLLISGGIYLLISKYMQRQSKKMDGYMYDLLKYGIVKDKKEFKEAMNYHERRILFNQSKWPFRIILLLTGVALALIYICFSGEVKTFFTEVFKLFPKIKWPTIKEINESIADENLKISGPGWLPASIFPTFISKHPDFSSPILYTSMIYYICVLFCMFYLIKSILACIARIRRGRKMAIEVFQKNLEKLDLYSISSFSERVNSPIPMSVEAQSKENDL